MKQPHDLSTKPYYRCILCPDFRTMCGGMPTRGLTLQEWCEMIRDVMDYIGLSCAYVAKEADASIRTVERIHAVKIDQDIMRSTARRIEIVVFGNATRLLCKMDFDSNIAAEKIAYLESQVAYWKRESELKTRIIEKYMSE